MAGRSVQLTTLFSWACLNKRYPVLHAHTFACNFKIQKIQEVGCCSKNKKNIISEVFNTFSNSFNCFNGIFKLIHCIFFKQVCRLVQIGNFSLGIGKKTFWHWERGQISALTRYSRQHMLTISFFWSWSGCFWTRLSLQSCWDNFSWQMEKISQILDAFIC